MLVEDESPTQGLYYRAVHPASCPYFVDNEWVARWEFGRDLVLGHFMEECWKVGV